MPALTCAEAIARCDAIVPVLIDNVRLAIEVKETLEEGNRIVPPGLRSRPTHGLGGYNVIHRSLTYNLALDLARIYDVSAGREVDRQDKASIPVLAHLLAKPDIRASLVARAREWTPTSQDEQARRCEDQLMRVAELWKRATENGGAAQIERLRDLRTMRLAHSLFGKEPNAFPAYADLFSLLAIAEPICEAASLCVLGNVIHLEYTTQDARSEATAFWKQVLRGLRPSVVGP